MFVRASRFITLRVLQPKIVTYVDEADLQKQMDAAEAETRQVSGDDDDDESGPVSGGDSGDEKAEGGTAE